MLIEHGAKVNYVSESGETPLLAAILSGRTEIADILIRYGANVNYTDTNGNTLLSLASRGSTAITKLLAEAGANISADSLMFATNGDIASTLIGLCADVNYVDKNGSTPIFKALSHDRLDVF